ncbi:MAG TPA: flippase-like domain-containing protein [Rhodospirillales bacterium]|nr:flippase-like domain-containing protein [Rhodospirillales bacterium]
MNDPGRRRRLRTVIWTIAAAVLAIGGMFVVYRNLDVDRLAAVIINAHLGWLAVLGLSIPLEQLVRSWKWRQILYDLRPIGSLRLFGAVMVGYFANMLAPVGLSPLVRAWLVARLENLPVATILSTTVIERFIDGIVFAVIVGLMIVFAPLPMIDGDLRLWLAVAGGGSLILFGGMFLYIFRLKDKLATGDTFIGKTLERLERAFGGRLEGLREDLITGIIWPTSRPRAMGVVAASVAMKLIAIGHFLWAGQAFGIVLPASYYLFIMVFTSFALIMSRFIRIPGGGVIGAAFALNLLGVAEEEALAMVTVVFAASHLLIAAIGAISMWKSGLTIINIRQYMSRQEG